MNCKSVMSEIENLRCNDAEGVERVKREKEEDEFSLHSACPYMFDGCRIGKQFRHVRKLLFKCDGDSEGTEERNGRMRGVCKEEEAREIGQTVEGLEKH